MNTVSILRSEDMDTRSVAARPQSAGCLHSTVTVLMCDIVSSTRLSTKLPAGIFRDLLLDYYRTCDDIVRIHNGRIVQYVGDGILCVFGAPFVESSTAIDAVQAGLNICQQDFYHRGIRYEIRVAASTGEIATGTGVGSGSALRDAVFGTVPYLAARLQSVTPPGSLIVDQRTFKQIDGHFSTHFLGPQELRGFEQPHLAWQVGTTKWISDNQLQQTTLSM